MPTLHLIAACFTTTGKLCLFPFKHRNYTIAGVAQNVTYRSCASSDIYEPWCATELDRDGYPVEWGYCLPDCPHETPKIVCQESSRKKYAIWFCTCLITRVLYRDEI